jgi:AhpD family alkylhydroperoxidase
MRITINPAIVAANFEPFKDNPSLQESAQLFAKGMPIAEMIQAFAMNRSTLEAFAGFDRVYPHGNLERGILEMVILCISTRNACQFCVNSHLDMTASLGIPNQHSTDPAAPEHTHRERLAIEYATAIHKNSNAIPEELWRRLHAAFTDPEIVELTFLTGFINMLNFFNNALEVRYHKEFDGMEIV